MKRYIAVLLVLTLITSLFAFPASALGDNEQNGSFSFDESTGTLTVFNDLGYEDFKDYSYEFTDPADLYKEVEKFVSVSGVTRIESYVFNEYYTNLETVIISNTVQTVYSNAFDGCSALKNVIFEYDADNNNQYLTIQEGAFGGCTSLKSISLPPTVSTINRNVFSGCTALENVDFIFDGRRSSYSFSEFAFKNCISLKEITLPPAALRRLQRSIN